MGAPEIVALIEALLTGGGEVAQLATQALAAWRAGDDQKALDLLDQALAKQQAAVVAARAELDAVKIRVGARIAAKFPEP